MIIKCIFESVPDWAAHNLSANLLEVWCSKSGRLLSMQVPFESFVGQLERREKGFYLRFRMLYIIKICNRKWISERKNGKRNYIPWILQSQIAQNNCWLRCLQKLSLKTWVWIVLQGMANSEVGWKGQWTSCSSSYTEWKSYQPRINLQITKTSCSQQTWGLSRV